MEPQQPEQPVANQPAPEVTQPVATSQGDPLQSTPHPRKWLIIGGAVLIGVLAAGVAVLGYQNFKARQQTPTLTPTAASELPPAPPPVPGETTAQESNKNFKRTNIAGTFSFEYPVGWHVADIWPTAPSSGGAIIAIDPEPISTAPRDGPLATFEIEVKNGLADPDATFNQDRKTFEESLSDIKTEVIQHELGPIYYYKGKIKGDFLGGEPAEAYFLTFKTATTEPIKANQQVVSARFLLKDDAILSSTLRKIVLSFKKSNP